MNTKNRKITFLVLIIFLTGVSTIWAKQQFHKSSYQQRCHGMEGMFEELDLSPDQKSQISEFRQTFKNSIQDYRQTMKQEGILLKQMMTSDSFDENQVRRHFRSLSTTREEILVARARMIQQIKGVLSPQQWEQFKKLREERVEKMKKEFGNSWRDSRSRS